MIGTTRPTSRILAIPMIGQQLGSFRIESKIGAGAMGEVYRATHVKTGKPAAVKVISAPHAAKPNATDRFEREVEILKQFRHPNIVRFLAVGRSKGTSYFSMEFIEGETLDHLIAKRELIPWQEAVDLGLQLCEALQYAHEHGVVHRDLKPSNIMITPDGTLKLTDFGIAKDLDATALTLPNRTLGTAAYMAPEQIKGTPDVSHKTDLYAFGCLLYQMLTGVTPFRGSTALVLMRAHAEEPPPRPSEKNPQIPRVLDNLVVKLMAKSPVDRPWDAQAVAAELRTLKEKLERGEPIKMAFGEPYVAPSRLAVAPTSPEVESRPQALVTEPSVTQDGTRKRKKRRKKGEGRALPSLGTIILGLALVVLLAGAFLLSRPKSMEQLYNDAKPLIESKKESQSERFEDWTTAEMRLEELEKRFPNHPYQKELQELHDKVALYKARGRARWIEGKRVKPQTDVEASYVATFTAADESVRQWQDHVAMQQWLRFVNEVEGHKDKSLRGWELLGRERAEELRVTMEQKRKELVKRLAQVQVAETSGEHELAIKLLTSVVEEFGQFGYLNDLVAPARAVLERAEQPPKEQ